MSNKNLQLLREEERHSAVINPPSDLLNMSSVNSVNDMEYSRKCIGHHNDIRTNTNSYQKEEKITPFSSFLIGAKYKQKKSSNILLITKIHSVSIYL